MILTPHILAGAVFAAKIENPFLAVPLAFLFHYMLDLVPHNEYSIDKAISWEGKKSLVDYFKIALDLSVGFFIIFFLREGNFLALLGGMVAILPDGINFLYPFFPKNRILKKYAYFDKKIVHFLGGKNISFWWRTLSQSAVVVLCIFLLLQ